MLGDLHVKSHKSGFCFLNPWMLSICMCQIRPGVSRVHSLRSLGPEDFSESLNLSRPLALLKPFGI